MDPEVPTTDLPSATMHGPGAGFDGWAALYDLDPDPHIVLEPVRDSSGRVVDFRYLMANRAACEFHRMPSDGLLGSRLLALRPSTMDTSLLPMYLEIVETGQTVALDDYAYPPGTPEDSVRYYEVRAAVSNGCIAESWRDVTGRRRASEQVAESEARLRRVLDAVPEPLLAYAPVRNEEGMPCDLVHTALNSAAEHLLGMAAHQVLGQRLSELFPRVRDDHLLEAYLAPFTTGRPSVIGPVEFGKEEAHGSLELSAYPFGDEILVIARNVSDRRRTEQRLELSERRLQLLANNSMDLVLSLDMHAVVDWVSPSVTRMLGYTPAQLEGQFGGILFHPDDLPLLLETAAEARAGQDSSCRLRMLSMSKETLWVEATPRTLVDDAGQLVGGVIGIRDITAEVAVRDDYRHAVDFDALTGLAKRSVALARVQDAIDTRSGLDWGLLCVGIDGMTAINEGYTYAAGDAVLVEVGQRLMAAAGAADRVARIAGDEFMVLTSDILSAEDAAAAAVELLRAVRGPVVVPGGHVDVTGCVGIALAGSHDAEELLRDATAAMRQAARRGPDRWQFLDGDIQTETRKRLAVRSALPKALADGRIRPWLMPIVRFSDGHVVGYEALARWQHRDGSIVAAEDFIEAAGRSALIVELDQAILAQALDLLSPPAGRPAHCREHVRRLARESGPRRPGA